MQIADPQAAPADIRKAYRELALKGHPHKDPEGPAETAKRSQEGGQTCAGEAEYKTEKGQSSGRMLKLSMIILAAMSLAYMTTGVRELTSSYGDWTTGNWGQRKLTRKAKLEPELRAWERNLLTMAGASMACQTTTHLGYNWCVAVLTMLAVGVRGHPEQEPELCRGRVSQGKGEEAGTREQTWTKPDEWTTEIGDNEVRNYTIIRKMETVDYGATLCVRHRTKEYL